MYGIGVPELIVLILLGGIFVPFLINANLAKSRGKNVAVILLLTIFLGWIVTLILVFFPKVETEK